MHPFNSLRFSALGLLVASIFPAVTHAATPDGAAIYEESCARCHNGGLTGLMQRAPRIGSSYWAERERAVGGDQLIAHTLRGYGRMAAQGGPDGVSEAEARAAVEHLLRAAKP